MTYVVTGRDQWGDKNPCWRGGKSTYACRSCGKEFSAYKSERDRGGAVFCSAPCLYNSTRTSVARICENCGKDFVAKRHAVDGGGGRFCSRKCSGAASSKDHRGEKHHCYREKSHWWKGGVRMEEGYVTLRTDNQRYEYEHRQIAEKALGRKFRKGEVVHHINGNKSDNRNENLLVCTNAYHRWLHERMSGLYMQEHFPAKPGAEASASPAQAVHRARLTGCAYSPVGESNESIS